jgi:tetratricopeptide (TPR) repeat protein
MKRLPKPAKKKREKLDSLYPDDLWSKPKNKIRLGLAALLFFTLIIYSPSIKNEILYGWDDGLYISDSFVTNFSLASIGHFFSSYYLGMFQPLAVLTLSLDYQAAGTAPSLYHLTNLLLHMINIVLVFYFTRRLCGKIEVAAIVTFLFAAHPMHVEAVAWIAARSTLLFTVFFVSSLIFYLKYLEEKRMKFIILTFLFFVLSVFTKSMAVSLPFILIIIDYYKARKITWGSVFEKVPFLAGSIVIGIVSVQAAASYGHISSLSESYSVFDRIFLLSYGIVYYIYKAILPVSLTAIAGYPFKHGNALPVLYYLAGIVIILVIFLVIRMKQSKKELLFGLLFFLFTISPVLPFVWSRLFITAERYSYLTFIGLYFIFAIAVMKLIDSKGEKLLKARSWIIAFIVILFAYYSIATFERTKTWKSTLILLTDIVEKKFSQEENVSAACYYRGNYYDSQQNYQAALDDYDRAIKLDSRYVLAYNNRGIVKGTMGNYQAAISDFTKAIELDPFYGDSFFNRGLAYYQLRQNDKACADWKVAYGRGFLNARKFIDDYCR